MFTKLAKFEALVPITGEDDEWNDVDGGLYQNKRCSAVFKKKDRVAFYVDAIIWKTQKGSCWIGRTDDISSAQNKNENVEEFNFHTRSIMAKTQLSATIH